MNLVRHFQRVAFSTAFLLLLSFPLHQSHAQTYDVCDKNAYTALVSLGVNITGVNPQHFGPGYLVTLAGSNFDKIPSSGRYIGFRGFTLQPNGKLIGSEWVYQRNFTVASPNHLTVTAPSNLPTGSGIVSIFYGEKECSKASGGQIVTFTQRVSLATIKGARFITSIAGAQSLPPRAPRLLNLRPFSQTRIDASSEEVENEDGYQFEYWDASQNRWRATYSPANYPAAAIRNLTPGIAYTFRVFAYNSAGASSSYPANSPYLVASTLPPGNEEGMVELVIESPQSSQAPLRPIPGSMSIRSSQASAFFDGNSSEILEGAVDDANLHGPYPRHLVVLQPDVEETRAGNLYFSDKAVRNKANVIVYAEIPSTPGALRYSTGRFSDQYIALHFYIDPNNPSHAQLLFVSGGDLDLSGRIMDSTSFQLRGPLAVTLPRRGASVGRISGSASGELALTENANLSHLITAQITFSAPLVFDVPQ